MSDSSDVVSLHPYFRIREGNEEAVAALLPRFVEKVKDETQCLYYEFTRNGDEVFCREGYHGAAGALAHVENVGPELTEMLGLSELTRLEVHGPAAELEKLKEPFGALNPTWWALQDGVPAQ